MMLVALLLAGCTGSPGGATPAASDPVTETPPRTEQPAETPPRTERDPSEPVTETQTPTATPTDHAACGSPTQPTVTLRDRTGTVLGTVSVTIADTAQERFTGLSETASLGPNEGMLFVYEFEGQRTFVMRNMSYPLDIIFVAPNGTITTIHHAETEPNTPNSELTGYSGSAQYVLEVNRGYTNETGVDEGDIVEVPATVD
jgi:uncharacterized membrane protein (UPF0127 family)